MISCDKGNTSVVGMGNVVLAEWETLTFAVLRGLAGGIKESAEDGRELYELQAQLGNILHTNLEENIKEASSDKTDEELRKEKSERVLENILGLFSENSKNLKS